MGPTRRALGYVRVSKAREEMISPELQTTAIEDWCTRNRVELTGIVTDLDATGRNFARKGVHEAITQVESGHIDIIVVWKWSRFGRNIRDSLVNIDRVEVVGGKVIAATEEFDDSPVGKFGRGQFLLMAEFESARIGEQWKETKARRIKQGLPGDGRDRYGYVYDRDTKSFSPDPETGPLLAEMYRRYIGGEAFTQIVADLNTQGIPGPRGGGWWANPLAQMLDSGFAAGLLRHRGELLPGAHEPLIDSATWATYLKVRAKRKREPSRYRSPAHPYAGLAVCRACGRRLLRDGSKASGAMRCPASNPGNPHRCEAPAWITERGLNEQVLLWLNGVADSINAQAEIQMQQKATRKVARVDAKRLAREIIRLDNALVRLSKQVAEGLVPREAFIQARDELMADRQRKADRLAMMEQAVEASSVPAPRLAMDLLRDWDTLDTLGKREVLSALVRRITVRPRWKSRDEPRVTVEPVWAIPTGSEPMTDVESPTLVVAPRQADSGPTTTG